MLIAKIFNFSGRINFINKQISRIQGHDVNRINFVLGLCIKLEVNSHKNYGTPIIAIFTATLHGCPILHINFNFFGKRIRFDTSSDVSGSQQNGIKLSMPRNFSSKLQVSRHL